MKMVIYRICKAWHSLCKASFILINKPIFMQNLLGIGSRVRHADFGDGVIVNVKSNAYQITFMEEGMKQIAFNFPLEVIEEIERDSDLVSLMDVQMTLSKVLQKWADLTEVVPLGDKWKGGTMVLNPGRKDLQSKEFPIDTFFHKIVMIRDRMRTLEQKVNASKMSDEDKLDIQQYITRVYGTLTSFNILFKSTEHTFVGAASVN
jgi:hypothetical protein